MQELHVIGVDNGALLVADDDGTRYRIAVDEVLQANLRQSLPDQGSGPKLSPREVQAHIRSGMSAHDVSAITGAPLEYIQRFEGPVIAEREFVVRSALAVPVRMAGDVDPLSSGKTFGTAIRERLHELGALGERWASWKEQGGSWIVKLAFTSNAIDHDARWQFDPKKQSLAPLNAEAISLSQGEASAPLIPRLRAVSHPDEPDTARFDSGAFQVDDSALPETAPVPRPIPIGRMQPEEPAHGNQTADLLEALRRRRGEREAASFDEDESRAAHPSTGSIRVVDVPLDPTPMEATPQRDTGSQPRVKKEKARVSMPSWDEIVFGARPDDDPA
jgi:hypothetical protein